MEQSRNTAYSGCFSVFQLFKQLYCGGWEVVAGELISPYLARGHHAGAEQMHAVCDMTTIMCAESAGGGGDQN